MNESSNRRPLNSRDTKWASVLSRGLANCNITPNQISFASMIFALCAGLAYWFSGQVSTSSMVILLYIIGALCIQFRLLCNLFDGMVAVEAGKSAADGAFWNEFPDRVSDVLIVVGVGLGVGEPMLGWAAASFCIFTAYVRELGASNGIAHDFSGPMAKPHRMAVMTICSILAILEILWLGSNLILTIALWIIIIGAGLTTFRRALNIRKQMLEK